MKYSKIENHQLLTLLRCVKAEPSLWENPERFIDLVEHEISSRKAALEERFMGWKVIYYSSYFSIEKSGMTITVNRWNGKTKLYTPRVASRPWMIEGVVDHTQDDELVQIDAIKWAEAELKSLGDNG